MWSFYIAMILPTLVNRDLLIPIAMPVVVPVPVGCEYDKVREERVGEATGKLDMDVVVWGTQNH